MITLERYFETTISLNMQDMSSKKILERHPDIKITVKMRMAIAVV